MNACKCEGDQSTLQADAAEGGCVSITAGIDIGSTAIKAVVFDGTGLSSIALPTGWNPKESGEKAFHEALRATVMATVENG